MTELLFPGHPGCTAARHRPHGAPEPCTAEPTHTVSHLYRHPRLCRVRLPVCAEHADDGDDPRPLTDEDRGVLDARRVQHDAALAGQPWIRVGHVDEPLRPDDRGGP